MFFAVQKHIGGMAPASQDRSREPEGGFLFQFDCAGRGRILFARCQSGPRKMETFSSGFADGSRAGARIFYLLFVFEDFFGFRLLAFLIFLFIGGGLIGGLWNPPVTYVRYIYIYNQIYYYYYFCCG